MGREEGRHSVGSHPKLLQVVTLDGHFGRIVGWTLILLGIYLLYSLLVHREAFRMQSRWMLIIGGVRRIVARFRREEIIEHEHEHAAFDVHHSGQDLDDGEKEEHGLREPCSHEDDT